MSVDKMPADKIAYSQLSLPAVEKLYSTFSDLFISLEIITFFLRCKTSEWINRPSVVGPAL